MPGDDLMDHAMSEHAEDFYELLGVTFETSEADIRKAYRQTALKYHPDKNQGNPKVIEKFHLLQVAYDVLSDPGAKAAYDNARAARRATAQRRTELDSRRRAFADDLEQRERSFKRKREEEGDDAEARLQRELKRLAADGKRRREEMTDKLRRDLAEEEARQHGGGPGNLQHEPEHAAPVEGGSHVAERDRSVKVRFTREGAGYSFDKHTLSSMFSRFGAVEFAFIAKRKKKSVLGLVIFKSIVAAHAAIEDAPGLSATHPAWTPIFSVEWGSTKEPPSDDSHDLGTDTVAPPSAPTTPLAATAPARPPFTPGSTPRFSFTPTGSGVKHVPPVAPFPSSANFEEATMMRLKSAERSRLAQVIRDKDAAAQGSGDPFE